MVNIGIGLACQIERKHIWIATMVDETSLVTIEHTIQTQWEELIVVDFLDDLLSFISFTWVVQIK